MSGFLVLFAVVAYFVSPRSNAASATASTFPSGIAAHLMAQAEACAGHDPHEASALRSAARDFLSAATQR